jgi:integrase
VARAKPYKRKLTALLLQQLKPKTRPFMVWDINARGLAIRVEPTGYRAWKFVYRHHNRPRWYHIGATNAVGLADARKEAARLALTVMHGKDPQAERRAERSVGTFEEIALRYREEYAKKRNKSWEQAAYLVDHYMLPRWRKLSATAVMRQDVKALLARINSPSVQTQVLASASAIFSWAIKEEISGIAVNPCSKIERPKTRSRERVLGEGEVPRFWAAFDVAGLVASSALKTILLTGQRPGEVAHMRREHIVDGWWEMPGEQISALGWPGTKNDQDHRVWLPQAVQKLLAELDEDATDGFVFTGTRAPVTNLDEVMRAICAQLGVKNKVTPHDLRRTHGTTITSLGFGREALNRIQNHKEGGISSVYDQYQYAEENKRIMEAVASRLLALAKGSLLKPGSVV